MRREFVAETLFEGVAAGLDVDRPWTRAALCASQLVGLGVLRLVVVGEPLASTSEHDVVALVAPTLQHSLTDPLRTTG